MTGRTDVCCVILASGEARRFGAPKGLAQLGDKSVIRHIVIALQSQLSGAIIVNCEDASHYRAEISESVPDQLGGKLGPLAGIHAALAWAKMRDLEHVMTVPVDTPFLPSDLAARFFEAGAPAVATSNGRLHPVIGLWSVSDLTPLEDDLISGRLKAGDWVRRIGAKEVDFKGDPFFNINTKEDLAIAERRLRENVEE